jgi:hypothetical protein
MTPRLNRIAVSFALALFVLFLTAALAAQASPQGYPGDALFQDPYPYPEVTVTYGYPFPEATQATSEPTQIELLPEVTDTPGSTSTPGIDLFATENAEMQDTLSTQAASATPIPSITPANTQTSPAEGTGTPSPAALEDGPGSGFSMDWGYFWIGFAIPVLAASGAVLYLLDRRPELFTQRPKP